MFKILPSITKTDNITLQDINSFIQKTNKLIVSLDDLKKYVDNEKEQKIILFLLKEFSGFFKDTSLHRYQVGSLQFCVKNDYLEIPAGKALNIDTRFTDSLKIVISSVEHISIKGVVKCSNITVTCKKPIRVFLNCVINQNIINWLNDNIDPQTNVTLSYSSYRENNLSLEEWYLLGTLNGNFKVDEFFDSDEIVDLYNEMVSDEPDPLMRDLQGFKWNLAKLGVK